MAKYERKRFKDLEEYAAWGNADLSYIPILDELPSFAAQALTRRDLALSYELLIKCFEEIKNDSILHTILCDTILYDEYNFNWYSTFFRELEVLLNKKPTRIPFNKCPVTERRSVVKRNRDVASLRICPTAYFPFYTYFDSSTKMLTPVYLEQNIPERDVVTNYRIYYISEQYEAQDFPNDTFPDWYLLKSTTVYEKYNEKTNVRVRIDYIDNRFEYFIAGASDNWKKVETFEDLEHVISSLLFKKQMKIF